MYEKIDKRDEALEESAALGVPNDTPNYGRPDGPLAKHHGFWILGGVLAGMLLAVSLAGFYTWSCRANAHLLCTVAEKNPPWLFLTGLAAAPAVLLTWYWRTKQRTWELHLQHAERRQKDTDLIRDQVKENQARAAAIRAGYEASVRGLEGPSWLDAADSIENAAWSAVQLPELRRRFFVRIPAFMREAPRLLQNSSQTDRVSYRDAMRAALNGLAILANLDETLRADLSGAHLVGMNLSGLNLRGAAFGDADLSGSDLSGTLLRGASLAHVKAQGATYSEATEIDDVQKMALEGAGARTLADRERLAKEGEALMAVRRAKSEKNDAPSIVGDGEAG